MALIISKKASLAIALQFLVLQLCNSQEPATVTIEYGEEKTCNISTNFDTSNFVDCEKKSTFFIHGWFGSEENEYFQEIVTALSMEPYNYNSFFVNWHDIASNVVYPAVDTDFVGECLAQFLLVNIYEKCKNHHVHLIGHSLGGHVAGICGRSLKQNGVDLDAITGLDPAGPGYYRKRNDKLSKKDAKFVVILHTDSYGYGNPENLGHVNFNANGGDNQPGCPLFSDLLMCSHRRSYLFFLESILTNQTEKFIGTNCMTMFGVVTMTGRHRLVFDLNVDDQARGVYCFDTNSKSPYAMGAKRNRLGLTGTIRTMAVGFERRVLRFFGLGRKP